MKKYAIALLGLSTSLATLAADVYQCVEIKDLGQGKFQKNPKQTVELTLDGPHISQRIHLDASTRALEFKTCAPLPEDGSNFTRWFTTECKELGSADKKPYTFEPYLLGAYAGISPPITPDYLLYHTLEAASLSAGTPVPERTFVIYVRRKPIFEFFCHKNP